MKHGKINLTSLYNNSAPRSLIEQLNLPTVVNDFVEFGYLGGDPLHVCTLTVSVSYTGFVVAKQYTVLFQYGNFRSWTEVLAFFDTGAYNGNDFSLEVKGNLNTGFCHFRLKRTSGNTFGVATILIEYAGNSTSFFVKTNITGADPVFVGSGSCLYQNFPSQRSGFKTKTPGTELQVNGGFAVTSSTSAVADPGAGNASISGFLSVASLRLTGTDTPPSNPTSVGTKGEIRWSDDYLYRCIATNTWRRVALSTW